MFTLPGLSALLMFLYLRPQEFIPVLQKLPLLYIFFAAAVGGLLVDLKLRLLKPIPTRSLKIAAIFFGWAIVTIAVKVPASDKVGQTLQFTIVFVTFLLIAQGVQRFRALLVVAASLLFCTLFLTMVGVHQANADLGCLMIEDYLSKLGVPDGRSCETFLDCTGLDAEPGEVYACQRIGLFGTSALDDRVRYRGSLQDPNELAAVVASGLALLIPFFARSRRRLVHLVGVAIGIFIFMCVIYTQSRGGMLAYMSVLGVYFLRRYGIKWGVIGVFAMLPLTALGGRGGEAAQGSTEGRYEAWAAGIHMLKSDPVFGVGKGQFTNFHRLTAHNSHVLSFAELGLPGFFLWIALLYMSFKIPIMALRDLKDPRAGPARSWAMGVIAFGAPYVVQMTFLSLTYHNITWVFFGLSGAFYAAVKRHAPDWEVKFGFLDYVIIGGICLGFLTVLPMYLIYKGFL